MELPLPWIFIFPLLFLLAVSGYPLSAQKTDWVADSPVAVSEGDVECFSEYMELWIHRARIEGLRRWLSGMMRIQVSLASLEQLNQQLSACGFALHKDPDKNYIFRVMYSGCFVQLQHGSYVIELTLLKRIHRFGGRSHKFFMKCPTVTSPPNREHIHCDPDFIQVTRQVPLDSWNKELQWSLALRGNLVVALEDASLVQVNVERRQSNITVQGRRSEILRPVFVMETKGEFLPLKLVSGHYAYSMEATCPDVSRSVTEMTVLHIFKRRMGLTKRGGYDNETLSISRVEVDQTDKFTWSENSDFVQLVIPTSVIQHNKSCIGELGRDLLQPFFRVDVVLFFKETNNKMHWTMENTLPCMRSSSPSFMTSQHFSTSESPLPVLPTHTVFRVDLHPKPSSPSRLFTETIPMDASSLTTEKAAPGRKTVTSAKPITLQFHHNLELGNITEKPTETQSLGVKTSTALKTSQAFTRKQQQPNASVSENTLSSLLSAVAAVSAGKAHTIKPASAGTGQALDTTLSPQLPSSKRTHQSLREVFASPQTEEKAGLSETVLTTPAATVKSNIAVTSSVTQIQTATFTKISLLKYNILLGYTNQELDNSIGTSPQTVTEPVTSAQASINGFMFVSQPSTISATQRPHQAMMSFAQSTVPTRKSITEFTSQFQSSAVSHESTQALPSSALTAEVEASELASPTSAHHTQQTALRKGTSTAASPHAAGPLTANITKLIPQVTAASEPSTTPTGLPVELLPPVSSTPQSPQTLVPSHSFVSTELDVRPTDLNGILHTSMLTAVKLLGDQSLDITPSTSKVISKSFISKQVPSSKASVTHHQQYVPQTKTVDSSQRQATTTPAQKPSMTWSSHSHLNPHLTPTTLQPEGKEFISEAVPTAPSSLTAQAEISISIRRSSIVPPLTPQPLKGNFTVKPEMVTNHPAVTEKPDAHVNISLPISQFHP